MSKLIHFGALRAERMRMKNDEEFKRYVKATYSKTEQERIRQAFLDIGKEDELPYETNLTDEGNNDQAQMSTQRKP